MDHSTGSVPSEPREWGEGHSYRFAGEAGYSTGDMAYSGPMLSPPWYTLQKKFKYTFGCDPAVTVKDLDTSQSPKMVVPIIVNDKKKGMVLRTLIRANFPMGNIIVITEVQNSKGESWQALIIKNEKQLRDVITDAYSGNPLFVEVKSKERIPGFPTQVGLIMTKTVVQFFNDDLSDYYSNFNGVTAEVMSDLINKSLAADAVQVLMGTQVSQ